MKTPSVNPLYMVFAIACLGVISVSTVHAQDIRLATFQETAQFLIDSDDQSATASIALQSTSNQEIMVPSELEARILENKDIASIIIINADSCIPGVSGEACILVNIRRTGDTLLETQETAKSIGGMFIDDVNALFGTDATYHSSYLHSGDKTLAALGTSGAVSGSGIVSAVFTMPMEPTGSMYGRLSSTLLSDAIKNSGGFYNAGLRLSINESSEPHMTFSMIPQGTSLLYQLRLSADNSIDPDGQIALLDMLGIDTLSRSDYLTEQFYPLNSLVRVLVSGDNHTLNTTHPSVPTQIQDGITIPTDVSQSGWVLEDFSGISSATFLFGSMDSVGSDDLTILLSERISEDTPEDQPFVIIIVLVAAAAAAVFFLRGYKKAPDNH